MAQFATAKIGAVLVTVNPAYRTFELEYVLRQSEAHALILIGNFRTSDYVAMLNEVLPELRNSSPGQLQSSKLPNLRHVIFIPPHPQESEGDTECPPGMWLWDGLRTLASGVTTANLIERQAVCNSDDVINIQYTSGTTGVAKGAMLTHSHMPGGHSVSSSS